MSFSAARHIALRGHRHLRSSSLAFNQSSSCSLWTQSASAATPLSSSSSSSPSTAHSFHHAVHYPLSLSQSSCHMSTIAVAAEEDGPGADQAPLFSSIPSLHPSSLHAIEKKMKLSTMTEIQHRTFEAGATGQDILGRARTGTGKTLAFLLPAIENALRLGRVPGPHGHSFAGDSGPEKNGGIAILILSPTRELAMQIHNQAQTIVASHSNSGPGFSKGNTYRMTSQVMFGGSSRFQDLKKLEDNMPFILVATPGRLIDHMENSHVDGGTPFSEVIGNVSVSVLDEADRCLDMGFRNDMEKILGVRKRYQQLAKQEGRQREMQERQTLLFSATLPKDLRAIMASHMTPDYLTVDCVHDIDPTSHTNANVDQSYVTLPDASENRWIAGLVDVMEDITHVQNPDDYKCVVFFPTTGMCQFFSYIFTNVFKIPVLEIHSKKSQPNRTSTSEKFRKWQKGILFTTDVSARGVDYPNVTHVIQFGSAEHRETYIHRLGRTGRAGKKGKGITIMGSKGEERQFIKKELKGLDVPRNDRYQKLLEGELVASEGDGGGGPNGALRRQEINEERLNKIRDNVSTGNDEQLRKMAQKAYSSLLGYNVTKMQNLGLHNKADVVELINSLAFQMGFEGDRMPALSPRAVANLGLKGVRGVTVGSGDRHGGGGGGRGGRGGGGRGRNDNRGGRGGRRGDYGGRGGYDNDRRGGMRQNERSDSRPSFQQRWDSDF